MTATDRTALILLLVISALALICTQALAFETAVANDSVTITGKAAPAEPLNFAASFQMQLPVEAGQYEYETSIAVPQKPNRLTVKVYNIKDLNAGVKMGIWLTKRFEATGGKATLSQSNLPPGHYDLKVFGQALEGTSSVSVEAIAETEVKADENGDYSLTIETAGMPGGEYTIRGAGQTKILRVNAIASPATTSDTAISSRLTPQPSAPEITGEVLEWYAERIGKDASNATQLAETETLLKSRLNGGYWKVISQGEPLTEEAGYCLQKYCLVRGIGACSSCRQKDLINNDSIFRSSTPTTKTDPRNESNDPPRPESQNDNLIASLFSWLTDIF